MANLQEVFDKNTSDSRYACSECDFELDPGADIRKVRDHLVETGHNGMLVYTAVGTVEYISIGFVLRDGKVEKEQQEEV
jgi:hypothetical protein